MIHAASGAGNVTYMSYNKEMTETYITDCAEWAAFLNRACSEVAEETVIEDDAATQRFRIDFPSGKSIVALPSKPRVLRSRGKPGDVADIDEAAFCDDLDELIDAALAVTQWGGKVRIISTHHGADNPFRRAGRRHPLGASSGLRADHDHAR